MVTASRRYLGWMGVNGAATWAVPADRRERAAEQAEAARNHDSRCGLDAMTNLTMEQVRARIGRVPLFAIFMRPTERYNVDSPEGQELMRQHLQFQLDLEDGGVLLAAGPLDLETPVPVGRPEPAEPDPIVDASGMYMVIAARREAAEAIAASEPFERAGWHTHKLCT